MPESFQEICEDEKDIKPRTEFESSSMRFKF